MNLFDARERSDASPSGHSESNWNFYDRVEGAYWDQVRSLLNDWFDHLGQDQMQNVIRGRLTSGENAEFRSAFAELYVHESLIRSGFSITYEPTIPGSERHPDFLATRAGESMFIEVTTRATLEDDPRGAKREASLHDALNSLPTDNFFLDFQVDARGPNAIGARPLKKRLSRWLGGLNPDLVAASIASGDHDSIPRFPYNRDGWDITFRAFPVKLEARGPDPNRRAIGISGGGARVINDKAIIQEALADKTHKYGSLNLPFIVALALDSFERDEEVEAALYGTPTVELTEGPTGRLTEHVSRLADGYWSRSDATRRSQVSGLLILPGFWPSGIAGSSPTLWIHPRADTPCPVLPSWATVSVVEAKLERQDAQIHPWMLFGLGKDWPSGVAFGDDA